MNRRTSPELSARDYVISQTHEISDDCVKFSLRLSSSSVPFVRRRSRRRRRRRLFRGRGDADPNNEYNERLATSGSRRPSTSAREHQSASNRWAKDARGEALLRVELTPSLSWFCSVSISSHRRPMNRIKRWRPESCIPEPVSWPVKAPSLLLKGDVRLVGALQIGFVVGHRSVFGSSSAARSRRTSTPSEEEQAEEAK